MATKRRWKDGWRETCSRIINLHRGVRQRRSCLSSSSLITDAVCGRRPVVSPALSMSLITPYWPAPALDATGVQLEWATGQASEWWHPSDLIWRRFTRMVYTYAVLCCSICWPTRTARYRAARIGRVSTRARLYRGELWLVSISMREDRPQFFKQWPISNIYQCTHTFYQSSNRE